MNKLFDISEKYIKK